jgi:hypothetical protein
MDGLGCWLGYWLGLWQCLWRDRLAPKLCLLFWLGGTIDIKSLQNRLLKVCYVPATRVGLNRLLFLLQPLTVVMKQTRQVVFTIMQSIYLDVYGWHTSAVSLPQGDVIFALIACLRNDIIFIHWE